MDDADRRSEKRRALYFGTGNSFSGAGAHVSSIMALNMDTGKILWWKQAKADDIWHGGCMQTVPGRSGAGQDEVGRVAISRRILLRIVLREDGSRLRDYAASPNLATMKDGRTVIIASPKQAVVRALDPDKKGETIWEQDIARGIGGGRGDGFRWGSGRSECVFRTAWKRARGPESRRWRGEVVHAAEKSRSDGAASGIGSRQCHPGVFFAGGMDGILRAVFCGGQRADQVGNSIQPRNSRRRMASRLRGIDRSGRPSDCERHGVCRFGVCGIPERWRPGNVPAGLCAGVF